MLNRYFYKEYRFWVGVVLLILGAGLYPQIINGRILTVLFWSQLTNISDVVFFIIAIAFLIQTMYKKNE